MKYAEMETKKCLKCGTNVRGRKLCVRCNRKENNWVQRTVWLKTDEIPKGISVQAIFNLGLAETKKMEKVSSATNELVSSEQKESKAKKTDEEILAGVIAWGKENGITEARIAIDDELDSLTD